MPSAIPPSLASYIQASLDSQSQTLITSVLSTPSTWLALRVVYAAIHGVEDISRGHSLGLGSSHNAVESRPVIFVSLLRPLSLWSEMGRKMVRLSHVFGLHFMIFAAAFALCTSLQRRLGPDMIDTTMLDGSGQRTDSSHVYSLRNQPVTVADVILGPGCSISTQKQEDNVYRLS